MVNKVMLIGNLGADPELRSTAGGTSVTNLRIATSERYKDGEEWKDRTEWHSVVCWGKLAEVVCEHTTKGRQLYVEGRLQTRKWQDREGADRYSTEIVADEVKFLGAAPSHGDDERKPEPAPTKGARSGKGAR